MIGKEVPKIAIPAEFGEGPLYQPELKREKTFGKGQWKGSRKGGGKSGGSFKKQN